MRLAQARVRNYRSVRDTGWFDVEDAKTILVGPNEAGKTVVLEALRRINAPAGVRGFEPLRDYPRKLYNADIQSGGRDPAKTPVVSARFRLEPGDVAELPAGFENATYVFTRYLGNNESHDLADAPRPVVFTEQVRKDFLRMAAHIDNQTADDEHPAKASLDNIIGSCQVGTTTLEGGLATELRGWLDSATAIVDENNAAEEERHTRLLDYTRVPEQRQLVLDLLRGRLPVFVYFHNYFRARPNLHLSRFAERIERGDLDDRYDYANQCLLKWLGFSARELANAGNPPDPGHDREAFDRYRDPLDDRQIKLNSASTRLTTEVRKVWNPNQVEADRLLVEADGQYLKVVVEDELGVKIEFDQRSEGFQWLVSFFVVFFAEATDRHANTVLLLDEPGLSLHGLKQREFRDTLSKLAESNQTLYTTHSPFLVGPDELDLVRVVEMTDHDVGTKVHSKVIADDPGALLPLQEALGYDLAQSLFTQQRNLVLEGLTDYWYLEATAQLLREANIAALNDTIALVPAKSAGKVVYFATILHANRLRVAALLDSDQAGNEAAKQDTLVHTLGNRNILRTADVCTGSITQPEIEDLLRDTLVEVASTDPTLGWNITDTATCQPTRPIISIFFDEIAGFSKYRLAKAYLRWTRNHKASDLTCTEREAWKRLINRINKALT